jgi:hypothetical protein
VWLLGSCSTLATTSALPPAQHQPMRTLLSMSKCVPHQVHSRKLSTTAKQRPAWAGSRRASARSRTLRLPRSPLRRQRAPNHTRLLLRSLARLRFQVLALLRNSCRREVLMNFTALSYQANRNFGLRLRFSFRY